MDNYVKYTISIYDDALMALLSLLPFESFEEVDGQMVCYIKEASCTEDFNSDFEYYLNMFGADSTSELILPQNWNAVWESNFNPVEVDDFCRIRADFHPAKEGFAFELTITPKMAFGTGHHETTHMMIQQMRMIDFEGKKVFDYGCGTGVLAILAKRLRAKNVVAVDIEKPSYDSTIENAELNNAPLSQIYHGDIHTVKESNFDVILANINRTVLLETAHELYEKMVPDGILLLSGILEQDEQMVKDHFNTCKFKHVETIQKGKWLCIKMSK